MNPTTLEHLKLELLKLAPTLRFGEYKGDGSFSIVVAATAGRVPCAIKFSKRPWATDPGVARERATLLDLMLGCNGHPHVATLIECWEIDGHLITRWELGQETLADRLRTCLAQGLPGIPREELLGYIQQAAEGIDFINGRETVHRDIKPDNLLLCQGQVKVVDFGFARLAELGSQTNSVLGTAAYTPPEAHGGRLQPNVDIYCLAATYIHLRTGKLPFGPKPEEVLRRKMAAQFEQQGLTLHEIEVLHGALQPDATARVYATAAAFVAALAYVPPPPVAGKAATPAAATTPLPAPNHAGRSFRDKVRGIVAREEQDRRDREAAEAARQAVQQDRFRELLHEQFDAGNFALCWGTLNYLQRLAPQDADLIELRKFLDAPDPKTGLGRGATSFGAWLTLIPDGEFLMGSPPDEAGRKQNEFQHRVRITKPFYMGIYPVTVAEFKRFVYARGHKTETEGEPGKNWRSPGFAQDDTHPVVCVSWNDAQAFCAWASQETQMQICLPTEAEWEYGCRGGAKQYAVYGIGNGRTLTTKQANFGNERNGTTPVGSFKLANGFGLYDMHGNVWECCQDAYDEDYYRQSPVDDPGGPREPSNRVSRGGGWCDSAAFCRSAFRNGYSPSVRCTNLGFRLAAVQSAR